MPPESDEPPGLKEDKFNFDDFINQNRIPLASFLIGLILTGVGVFMYLNDKEDSGGGGIEVISAETEVSLTKKEIVVEVAGEVEKPGVYKLEEGARIEDLLTTAGDISGNADTAWVQKYVNRATKLTDGQKLYIPTKMEQSEGTSANKLGEIKIDQEVFGVKSSGLININNASLSELDTLPGIGQVYGQKIIEHRPYSNIEELESKGVLKKNVFEKVKDKISVF